MQNVKLIACCGIDCSVCDVRRAPVDPELAMSIAKWIQKKFNTPECKPETISCTWCRGDKEGHWSPDCWILKCCVDDKGLEYCSDCDVFPCEKLSEWSKGNEKYSKAFERLQKMHSDK